MKRAHPRGVGFLPVIMILLFLLPLISIFLRRAGDEVGFSFRDRNLRLARGVAAGPVTDFMQLFSQDQRGEHYLNSFLSRTWGTGETNYGAFYSSISWNAREYAPFTELRVQQEHLFVFSSRAKLRTRNEPVRGQSGVIQFQSDLMRYGLICEADLTVGVNHPLANRTVQSLWVGGDLQTAGVTFGVAGAFEAFAFANRGLAVVKGDVTNVTLDGLGRGFYGGAGGFTGGTSINYVPVEVSTVPPGIGDLNYFNNHGSTVTVVDATVTFHTSPNRIGIDRGLGVQYFTVGASSGTVLVAREGANLFINDPGANQLPFPLTVVTVGGGAIYINDGVRYLGGGSATAARNFAAISSGNLVLRPTSGTTQGFYYAAGDITVSHATPGQVITLNGTLMSATGVFEPVANGERLNIVQDLGLRTFYPPMLPERPQLVQLRVRT